VAHIYVFPNNIHDLSANTYITAKMYVYLWYAGLK